jgi:MFS superfamily sulfate permease-like transporter
MIGIVTMIANPNWTERIIPALVGTQLIGFILIAFAYMIRSQFGPEISPVVSTDPSAKSENVNRPQWSRMRWLWFGIAALGVAQTPIAIVNAIHTAQSDHRMAPVMVLAFAIRFGMIWLFLRLWWKFRPVNQ